MGNSEIPTPDIKNYQAQVYDKTSKILTQIQNHADQGCEHCLKILKTGLSASPEPATISLREPPRSENHV